VDINTAILAAIAVIDLLGFGLAGVVIYRMGQQVGALKGTVKTQADAMQALATLNERAVEMVNTLDPKKIVEKAKAYEELVEKNARAEVEDARRSFEREYEEKEEKIGRALSIIVDWYKAALRGGYHLISYVPKADRRRAIETSDVPDRFKKKYLELVDKAPDLTTSGLTLNALVEVADRVDVQMRRPRTAESGGALDTGE